MKSYNVYISHKDKSQTEANDLVLVYDGFSWYCLLFSWLWAIYNRVWSVLFAYVIVAVTGAALAKFSLLPIKGVQVFSFISYVMISFHANDLYGKSLVKRGYKLISVSIGRSYDEALLRFIDRPSQ
jgi:bacteriorhodopsin